MRRTALPGTEMAEAQVGTIRLQLFKVAARVVQSARRVVFHPASGYPYRTIFQQVHKRVIVRPSPTALDGS